MKNVKTMYRKLTMMVVLGILLAVMSCNNLLTPPKGNSTDRDSGSGNVSEDGKVLITIKLFTGSARMVMPDIEQLDWHITAKQGTDNIEATGTYPTYTLELPTTGPWTFTVKGTKENKELFTGTVTENVSNSTTSISIPLSPGSGMTEGSGATGKLNLTIKPENVNSMSLKYRIDGSEEWGTTVSFGEEDYTIGGESLSVGQHTLDLYFFSNSDKGKFYFCTVAVNIWPGMTSDQWIKTNGEEYINDSGEFVITEEMVNEFVKTMGSVVFVDASVDANTPATGSIFAPVKTVSTAVDILRKANPGGNYSGTIMVSGATTITNEVQVKSGETLTIKGTGADASITNDKGRVFNIASGGSLTLEENITLKGTVTNDNGGAVYVNGGTFTMKAGSKITESSASYGGGVYVDSKGTFTMGGGAITESSATGTTANGGAVYVANGSFTMSGTATLQGNTAATHGGGVHIFSGGTFTMNGGTIDGTIGGTAANTATYGGGVYVSGGTFNMNGGTISGNTVAQSGGGVCVSGGEFTMSGGAVISGNTATSSGGGVFVSGSGDFTMKGGTIGGTDSGSHNSAENGGGVYIHKGTFTMNGGAVISGNSASSSSSSGGGVYIFEGTFTMSDSAVISGNSATSSGGGVYVSTYGTFTMKGGTIGETVGASGNSSKSGGGVCVYKGGFTMSDGSISGNSATKSGGGVFVQDGTFTMEGGTIGGAIANTASQNGGGIYLDSTGGTVTLNNTSSISGNVAAVIGSGVYVAGGTFTVSGSSLTITDNAKNNVYLASGKTITIGAEGLTGGTIGVTVEAMESGGAIPITDEGVTGADEIFTSDVEGYAIVESSDAVYLSDAETMYVTIDDKYMDTFEAALDAVNASGGTITLLKDIDSSNAVFGTNNDTPITFTGGAEANPIILDLNGKTIDRGLTSAKNAGSVIKIEGGTLTIKDSSAAPDGTGGTGMITGGNSSGGGGGIHITSNSIGPVSGSLILESGTVSGNFADGSNGGGVYIAGDCTFTMKGGSIDGNTVKNSATSHGGGVFVGGIFTMENGIITNNSSEQGNGGGVNIGSNGTFTMSGGTISGNTATSNGGGVCVSGDGLGFSTFTMTGGTLSGNTATSGNGGGVYVGTGSFTLGSSSTESSPVVSGNTKTDSSPNNVYLYDNTLLLIAGKLKKSEESGNIGVSMSIIPGVFTSNWSSSGLPDSTFFFSDKEGYGITGEGGELKMAPQSEIP